MVKTRQLWNFCIIVNIAQRQFLLPIEKISSSIKTSLLLHVKENVLQGVWAVHKIFNKPDVLINLALC